MKLRVNWYYVTIGVVNLAAIVAIACIIAPLSPAPVAASIAPPTPPAVKKIGTTRSGVPERIEIPSLSLNIPIQTGSFDAETRQWTLDDQHAFYADYSVQPNEKAGATLIYAHARWGLFGALPDLLPGAEAVVRTSNDLEFRYQYNSSKTVSPEDTSIFTKKGAPTLVLQTCSGTFSQNRTLYHFSLDDVSNTK